MSSQFRQTAVMIRASLGSMPRRIPICVSMVFSVALVVCVLIGFLSMANGFEKALETAGSPSVAVILGGGTNQETGSDISSDAIRSLQAMSGNTGILRNTEGQIDASREIIVPVEVGGRGETMARTSGLRGMDIAGMAIRENAVISSGRAFSPGSREIVVGSQLARDFPGFGIGEKWRSGTIDWIVVGHFTARGSALESEIWADLEAVQSAFNRQGQVQTLRARLVRPDGLETLQKTLGMIAGPPLNAVREADLYAAQSGRITSLIRLFGWPIAFLMAIGATAGALNTMMSSVSDKAAEIATVRILGFSRISAFLATWFEALLLALAGAMIGTAISWLVFNGWQASTSGANNMQMAFHLEVSVKIMLQATLFGLMIGLIGGAIPAFAATRLPLVHSLRKAS